MSVEEMMEMNQEKASGVPLFVNKPPISPTPIGAWKKPHFMSHGGAGSSGSKPCYPEPSDERISVSSMDTKVELQSPPSTGVQLASGSTIGAVSVKAEHAIDFEIKFGRSIDPNMDPKKLRRIISNRISAQKSRTKKLQYISDMEEKVKELQSLVGMLSPQIAYEEQSINQLRMENGILKQKIDAWTDRSKVSYVQTEIKGAEIRRLKELERMQKHDNGRMFGWNYGMGQASNMSLYNPMVNMINSNKDELDQILSFESLTVDPPKRLDLS